MDMKKEKGRILATVNDNDKEEFLERAKEMNKLGYKFVATSGTYKLLKENNINVERINKIKEGNNNILEAIKNNSLDMIINTPTKGNESNRDGFIIRREAIEKGLGVITVLDTLRAMVKVKKENINVSDLEVFDIVQINS